MVCPIAGYKVDENGARWVALGVVLLVVLAVLADMHAATPVYVFLVLDFAARAFSRPSLSPLARLSGRILSATGARPRRVDAGPKRFAARIGLGFSLAALASTLTGFHAVAASVALTLAFCALLEAAFGFCVGCSMYQGWYSLRLRLEPSAGSRHRSSGAF